MTSESRARAFLWLCHHYYEATLPNPFDDAHSRKKPGHVPALETLSSEEAALENVDTPEEKEWGEKMTAQRKVFMANKDKLDDIAPEDETPRERSLKRAARGKGRVRRGKAQVTSTRAGAKISPKASGRRGSSPDGRNSLGRVYDGDDTAEGMYIV